ncbi:response regulator [Sphingomonas echinoides]|uniref:Response regulator n=1 Tax=Sphingomonas echinoides TaxID=59803 RepID=A0ABU4PG83_9SPHN|nr:response regulator [Sphingomonas echinoides]MDX5982862.1 response regulator [Sphingomonas echinoides]
MDEDNAVDTGPRPQLLLVEDDEGVRRSLHLLLHWRGFDVRSYASAGALLEETDVSTAKWLVTDYRLPDGDGIGVLRSMLRRDWHGRSILITAYPDPTLRAVASMNGFHAVLDKPIRQHELIAALA